MKTAVCLYGQPRNINQKIQAILQNVIVPNNADVFFHAWFDKTDTNIKKMCPGYDNHNLSSDTDKLLMQLSPKSYIIEKQKNFNAVYIPEVTRYNIEKCYDYGLQYDTEKFSSNTIFRCHSMWYSIHQCNLLKYLYELNNGIRYECVVRMRYDNTPLSPIDLNKFNMNKYWHYDINQPDLHISDWFNFSNSTNMNIASTLFFNIDVLIDKCLEKYGYWCNELLLYTHLSNHEVEHSRTKWECSW